MSKILVHIENQILSQGLNHFRIHTFGWRVLGARAGRRCSVMRWNYQRRVIGQPFSHEGFQTVRNQTNT